MFSSVYYIVHRGEYIYTADFPLQMNGAFSFPLCHRVSTTTCRHMKSIDSTFKTLHQVPRNKSCDKLTKPFWKKKENFQNFCFQLSEFLEQDKFWEICQEREFIEHIYNRAPVFSKVSAINTKLYNYYFCPETYKTKQNYWEKKSKEILKKNTNYYIANGKSVIFVMLILNRKNWKATHKVDWSAVCLCLPNCNKLWGKLQSSLDQIGKH